MRTTMASRCHIGLALIICVMSIQISCRTCGGNAVSAQIESLFCLYDSGFASKEGDYQEKDIQSLQALLFSKREKATDVLLSMLKPGLSHQKLFYIGATLTRLGQREGIGILIWLLKSDYVFGSANRSVKDLSAVLLGFSLDEQITESLPNSVEAYFEWWKKEAPFLRVRYEGCHSDEPLGDHSFFIDQKAREFNYWVDEVSGTMLIGNALSDEMRRFKVVIEYLLGQAENNMF